MSALKAHVRDGRLQLDEPTDLPEGAEVLLFPSEEQDDLDEEGGARLYQALCESQAEVERGAGLDRGEFMAELRAPRDGE